MSDKDFVIKNGLVVGTTATINGIEIDPSGATENQILKFNGTKFAPATNTGGGGVGSTYAGTIGNGTDTEFTVTHNLSTRDVVVVARNALTPYEQIDVRWEATSVNTVKFDFSSPPASNSVRVAVYAAVAGNTLATTTVSTSAPENPTEGDLWFDSNSAGMFVYYDSQWIEIGGSSSGARLFVGTTPPTNTAEGILWFNSNTAQVFVKYDSQWIEVGAFASSIDVSNAQTNDTLKFDGTKFVASAEGIFNDNILLINNGTSSSPTNNAGIEIERGNSNNVLIRWNESTDVWEFTNNGSSYQELGKTTAVVSATAPSSPYEGQIWFDSSDGGTYVYYGSTWIEVGAAPVDAVLQKVDAKGDLLAGDAADSLARLAVGTNGQFLTANSSTATGLQWTTQSPVITLSGDLSGSATLTNLGSATLTATIADGIIVNADINASAAIDKTKISGTAVTLSDTGTVTSTMIADGTIVNTDINMSAAIALSKLASGTSGQVVIANASGVPTYTTLSGDLTISSTGVVSIAANSVTLGTDTTGDYVQSLVAGTGITLSNNSGEGSTPTITVDTSAIQARVANVSDTEISYLDGVTSSIQTQINTKASTGKAIAMAIVFGG